MEATKWVNTNQAAKLSGYDPQHVRRLARQNRVRARKVIDWWIDLADLLQYRDNSPIKGNRNG